MSTSKLAGTLALFAGVALLAAGCGKGETKGGKATTTGEEKIAQGGGKDDHGWWCKEHGVPEEECSLCLSDEEVEKRFKSKGDWCKVHERAQSQCFKCNPKLYETFAQKYRDRYGEEAPRPPASEFRK